MLKALHGGGYITVHNGGSYSLPYISEDLPFSGNLRLKNQTLQVFDGRAWLPVNVSEPLISLDPLAQEAISWATRKRLEEERLEKELNNLSKENAAVKAAVDNLEKAKTQLEVTILLSKDHDKTTS